MSVEDGYFFYAIDLTNDKGAIVRGYEPEFEEVEKVANQTNQKTDAMSKGISFVFSPFNQDHHA